MRKPSAKPSLVKRPPITRRDFVGAQMSNFLYALKQESWLPEEYRQKAAHLQEEWDAVSIFQLNNPIVAAELEANLPK